MRAKSGLSTLVLNASFEPLTVVSAKRALILLLADKAECLDQDLDRLFHAGHMTFPAPVVIRLNKFVKVPYSSHVGLSRRAVMARDGGKCVYCGKIATTLDHVVPKAKGGQHAWDNVVACCQPCNNRKGHKTLAQMGWTLPKPPRAPSGTAWRIIGYRTPDPRWEPWLNF